MARYIYQNVVQDGSGNFIPTATVTMQLAGLATLATIYTAVSGGTADADSVVLTSSDDGTYLFYVDDTDYGLTQRFKITMTKDGYSSESWDYIQIFPYASAILTTENTFTKVQNFSTVTVASYPANNNLAQFDAADSLEDSGESIAEIGVLDTAAEWTGQQNFNELAITSTATATAWNLDTAQTAVHTLTENTTISAPSNMNAGGTYVLRVVQAAGVYTLAFNAVFEWGSVPAPEEPAADGDVVIISFYSDGSTMYGGEFNRTEA
jgi:hypothetical protein